MKLKKLDIQGFKSFLEKTSIEFPRGVSAIVGPNGCGKSNVVDAIRWAMGEQSVKQLRGKSMEDIIFAGADSRSPMNMAEVSLTMLNDNGSAPEELKDFTEIQVTRRLYRSGESAYLLNRKPCRLKDIHNLFLGSGMGSRSYAVIQQGNIGAITEATPEERRAFIEEAAGVSRYKARKKEALRKVEATHQNLLRLNDIISEVNRQMAGLKRQAQKAERYNKLQKRIKKLDVLTGLYKYDELTRLITETKQFLKSLKDADIGHTTALKKLDATVEKIKLERWQKNQEISRFKSEKNDTQRGIDRLENDLSHLRRETEELAEESSQLASARTELDGKNRHIAEEVSENEHEIENLSAEVESVKKRLDAQRKELVEAKGRLAPLSEKLEGYKKQMMELVAREARLKNIYQNAAQNKESLERRLKRIDEEAVTAQSQVQQLERNEASARRQLAQCQESLKVLESSIQKVRETLNEKARSLGQQVKQVQTLEMNRKEVKARHAALKRMDDNLDWYRDGVKAIFKQIPAEGSHGPAGIMCAMADIISPEPGYETAAEAVLGEALQYVLVKDQAVGRESIAYLTEQDAGRAGFIPMSHVKTVDCGGNAPDPDRLLLNHIRVPDEFIKAAESLLGHVVVASDLEDAIGLYNRNGVVQTIVTIDGQMISPQGIMTGGSKDKLSGILEKKREIRELEETISSLDAELNVEKETQHELENEVRKLEIELQQQIEEKNHVNQSEMDAEKGLYKVSEELKSARRHLEIVELEQDQLFGEQSDIDQEMEKYDRQLAQMSASVKEAQDNVAGTSEEMESLAGEVETRNQALMDIQLTLTAKNAHLENNTNTLRRLREFQNDGARRLEQITEEIEKKLQKLETNKEKISQSEQRLAQSYEAFQGLNSQLENTESDYETIDAQLKENDKAKSEIETKRQETLEKIRYVELEQSQREMKRENVASRLEERYHQRMWEFRAKYGELLEKSDASVEELEEALKRNREKLGRLGDVNTGAIKEYEQHKTRYDFLTGQRDDLLEALEDLNRVIRKINRITQERFTATFDKINAKLGEIFPRLFEGGTAKLILTEPNNPLETGVEFMISPPGKKLTRLSLLSGGEKALSAIAFIFSIFLIKPASFCLLDEIDAPLDEANVYRFNNLLKMIGEKSQIIMITHNKKSMEFSDILFGVTMPKKGISKVVSVNLSSNGNGNGDKKAAQQAQEQPETVN